MIVGVISGASITTPTWGYKIDDDDEDEDDDAYVCRYKNIYAYV